jgi:hypothetical protein
MATRWVVRVVTQGVGSFDTACERSPIIECLRYAGLITVHRDGNEHGEGGGMCFDILPPDGGLDPCPYHRVWADHLAAHMQSHGINAVVAPEMK